MAVMSAACFVEFRQRLPWLLTWTDVVVGRACPVALIRAFHARSKRPDLIRARKVRGLSADDPPAHAWSASCAVSPGVEVGSVDPPEPMARNLFLQGVVACDGDACGRRRVPVSLGPVRRSGGIAKVAQRPDHLGDATGIVTEDLAVLLEPAGRHGMVGRGLRCSQACQKSITSVSGDRVSRKVQLSAAPSAIATIPISGRARLMCGLRLQAAPSA